jgi:hypothetical protein
MCLSRDAALSQYSTYLLGVETSYFLVVLSNGGDVCSENALLVVVLASLHEELRNGLREL